MTQSVAKRRRYGFFSHSLTPIFAVLLIFLLIKYSDEASMQAKNALTLCGQMLIPSLFSLTVAGEIATASGALEALTEHLTPPLSRLFGISDSAASPYFLGLVGGYTASCRSAILLLNEKRISRDECERIIAVSNIPSLAFITGFAGAKICGSTTDGWIIWFSSVGASVISGFLCRAIFGNLSNRHSVSRKSKQIASQGLSRAIVSSVSHTAQSMLMICACVVFFSVLIEILGEVFVTLGIPTWFSRIFLGLLEITRGVGDCAAITSRAERLILCSAYTGWSGLCVHFQVISVCDGKRLKFGKYFIIKLLQGVISAALSAISLVFIQ